MIWKKSLWRLVNVSVTLPLGLLIIPSFPIVALANPLPVNGATSWKIAQTFTSLNQAAPANTVGGGTRGSCSTDENPIVPLIPPTTLEYTVAANPTFFLYVPQSLTKDVKFSLVDKEKENTVYEVTFKTTNTSGIVSVSIPSDPEKSLQVGKTYIWSFEIVCDPNDASGNLDMQGSIQRIEPSEKLQTELGKTTDERDRPQVYAKYGIWYETLTNAASLLRSNPNDSTVTKNWNILLTSVGLGAIANAPLVDCCQIAN